MAWFGQLTLKAIAYYFDHSNRCKALTSENWSNFPISSSESSSQFFQLLKSRLSQLSCETEICVSHYSDSIHSNSYDDKQHLWNSNVEQQYAIICEFNDYLLNWPLPCLLLTSAMPSLAVLFVNSTSLSDLCVYVWIPVVR